MKMTKEYKPEWVHIYDNNNDVAVKISFHKVEFNPTFAETYFVVENNMEEAKENWSNPSSSTIYELPLYPVNADVDSKLKELSDITIDDTKHVLLTYAGTQNFTILETNAISSQDVKETLIDGEIVEIYGTIGYVTTNGNINKLYFTSNGVSYQIWSDCESVSTLIEIASGMEKIAVEEK
jgi:hypothetical protein